MIDLRLIKRDLRLVMKEHRVTAQAENPSAAAGLRDTFLRHASLPPQAVIGSYSAIGSEMDPAPLAEALRNAGHPIALPVIVGEGQPLLFRRYQTGDALAKNTLGILEPLPDAAEVQPDILLVPLLAFDRRRHRLGYGGGFYDRTIKHLRERQSLTTIGLAFACLEVPEVPTGRYDVRLDKIATEIQVLQA